MTTFSSQNGPIPLEILPPSWAGKRPAVVVAYGIRGMNGEAGTAIHALDDTLADGGYAVFIPDYFEATGTASSSGIEDDIAVTIEFTRHGKT